MNLLDTAVWLANFPVAHGYATVFIAGFSIIGLFALSARGAGASEAALRRIREREGLEVARPRASVLPRTQRIVFRVLAVVMLGSLVIGILSLIGMPVTRGYIHENGRPTTASVDGRWITFTTADGVEYTLENDVFTPAVHPDIHAEIASGQPVVVRYLPDHPQAFVIDSSQMPR